MPNNITQAVILAGGRGTRLRPFTDTAPKPMYPIEGEPFMSYLIKQVKGFGIEQVVLLLGYRAETISNYLNGHNGYGLDIVCDITPEEYETGDRILHAKELLDDRFLFMYCDNYCPIDYNRLKHDFEQNNSLIQISAYKNTDGYTKNNLLIDDDTGIVLCYDKARKREDTLGVDIGYALISKEVLELAGCSNQNFEAAIYPEVVTRQKLFATVTEHRYYSIGSWDRIKLTEEFFHNRPTVFLDRDGTLNKRPLKAHYIERPEEFVWIEGAKEAVKLLKENNYRVILITNQPGIARGNLTKETLDRIHQKMQRDLADCGVEEAIDDIIYCPHNWDEGCDCRKPKPGMLYQAQKRYSLNLTNCVMIGDDDRDMEAGHAAGCLCIQVSDDYPLISAVKDLLEVG